MKKIALSLLIILTFSGYVYYLKTQGTKDNINIPDQTNLINSYNNNSQSKAKYKDGEYIGPVVDAYYGNIQVKAVIKNGLISDVIFLQYPNDRNTSIRINTDAIPYLRQEAIQAQSASVDIVTGATQSSEGFIKSLSEALSKAQS